MQEIKHAGDENSTARDRNDVMRGSLTRTSQTKTSTSIIYVHVYAMVCSQCCCGVRIYNEKQCLEKSRQRLRAHRHIHWYVDCVQRRFFGKASDFFLPSATIRASRVSESGSAACHWNDHCIATT